MDKIVRKKVIRRAITAYERICKEEELRLVHKAVKIEMGEIKTGNTKTHSFDEIEKILKK